MHILQNILTKKTVIFVLILVLLAMQGVFAETTKLLLDDFETHQWHDTNWGNDVGTCSYSDYWSSEGDYSLKLEVTDNGTGWYYWTTEVFEAIQPNYIRMRVKMTVGTSGAIGAHLKLKAIDTGDNKRDIGGAKYLSTSSSYDDQILTFTNTGNYTIKQLRLELDSYQYYEPKAATVYIDNIEMNTGSGYFLWDSCESHNYWNGSADAGCSDDSVARMDDLSRSVKSTGEASIAMEWDTAIYDPAGDNAVLLMKDPNNAAMNLDIFDYTFIEFDFNRGTTHTDTILKVYFYDGANGGTTTAVTMPASANTWEHVILEIPRNVSTDYTSIDEIKFEVSNTNTVTVTSGKIYFDNLYVGKHEPEDTAINPKDIGVPYQVDDYDGRVLNSGARFYDDIGNKWVEVGDVITNGETDFMGGSGTTDSDGESTGVTLSSSISSTAPAFSGAAHSDPQSLKLEYDVDTTDAWAAFWMKLFPGTDNNVEANAKDLSLIDKLSIWVKSGGSSANPQKIKVEFQDYRWGAGNPPDDFDNGCAYFILQDIPDSGWAQFCVDLDDAIIIGDIDWENIDRMAVTFVKASAADVIAGADDAGTLYVDDIVLIDTYQKFTSDSDFDLSSTSAFLKLVEERLFQYFLDSYEDNTGLFYDRAHFLDLSSTASCGFGLTALVIGVENGWIDGSDAQDIAENCLGTFADTNLMANVWADIDGMVNGEEDLSEQLDYIGYKGFFFHFLDPATGKRKNVNTELSTIDTTLLLAGAIACKEYFSTNSTIGGYVDDIYNAIQWDWFFDSAKKLFYLGWKPEDVTGGDDTTALSGLYDVYTDELLMMALLAIGADETYGHPVSPDVFYSFLRKQKEYKAGFDGAVERDMIASWQSSSFHYFFAHCWFDLNDKVDKYGVNWWDNSVKAGLANRDFCIDGKATGIKDYDIPIPPETEPGGVYYYEREDVSSLGANSWGLSSCEGIPYNFHDRYLGDNGGLAHADSDVRWVNYATPEYQLNPYKWVVDGTVPVYGGVSFIGFAQDDDFPIAHIKGLLKNYYQNTQLWTGWYGFRDAYTSADKDGNDYIVHQIKHDKGFGLEDVETDDENPFPIYKNQFFGLDHGPMLLMIENYRNDTIWDAFMSNDNVSTAMLAIFTDKDGVNESVTNLELDNLKVLEIDEDNKEYYHANASYLKDGYVIVDDTKSFTCYGYIKMETVRITDDTDVTFTANGDGVFGDGFGASGNLYFEIKDLKVKKGSTFKLTVNDD